jgi:hypothetical protein
MLNLGAGVAGNPTFTHGGVDVGSFIDGLLVCGYPRGYVLRD